MPKLFLPLFLLAAIGLTVYLAQQPTELTPSAAEAPTTAPTGCTKVTPGTRSVRYKACQDSSRDCGTVTPLVASNQEQDKDADYKFPPGTGVLVAGYPLKESVWDFGGNWKLYSTKGPRQSDGDRSTNGKARFDGPDGKSYQEVDDDPIGADREGTRIIYREIGGQGTVVEFAYTKSGTNYQGLPGTTYDSSKSYAFVPDKAGTKCDGTGSTSTGSKANGAACTPNKGVECKSGVCTNSKCVQGTKAGNAACTNPEECTSNTCSNGKCAGGAAAVGKACDDPSDCASNKCENNKCVSATASASPSKSASPKASGSGGGNGGGGGGGAPSTAPGATATASASTAASATPAASGGTVPVSLTKAEIIGFKNSYDLLNARLGSASGSGNLKITAAIAKNELAAIVAELPGCPDNSAVGPCLDQKFRTRFDFAKTAARLSAFYAIFNNISGICVKADLGLNPLITATSVSSTLGRVNLCTEPAAAKKLWRAFVNGQFIEIVATDTRWPANPTCATLPTDVLERYRRAEGLFSSQAGFTANTLCDGKTTVAPGN